MIDIGEICSRYEQSAWRKGCKGASALPEPETSMARRSAGQVRSMADFPDPGWAQPGKRSKAATRIEKAIAYMLYNLNEPVRMSTLSKLTGVSTSNFYHLFKQATGATPNDFFIRARMRRACWLLRETSLSIKEIAVRLGYDDPFYFSRQFKSVHGLAPRHFRCRSAESKTVQPGECPAGPVFDGGFVQFPSIANFPSRTQEPTS